MSRNRNTVVKSWSTKQCKESCDNRKRLCLMGVDTDPDPRNSYYRAQCYNGYAQCIKNCTTRNIR